VFIYQADVIMTATLNFSGSVARSTGHKLTGGLSFAGNIARQIPKTLAAALSFTGGITGIKIATKVLNAVLGFQNVILNWNYEYSSLSDVGSYWTGSYAIDNTHVHSGDQALKVTSSDTAHVNGVIHWAPTSVNLPAGTIVESSSIWLWVPNGLTVNVANRIASGGTHGYLTESQVNTDVIGNDNWQEVVLPSWTDTSSSFTPGIQVHLVTPTSGVSWWCDDVHISISSLSKQTDKGLTAIQTFTGLQARLTSKGISAFVGFLGSINRRVNRPIKASINFNPPQGIELDGRQNYLSYTGTTSNNITASSTWSFIATIQPFGYSPNNGGGSAVINNMFNFAGGKGIEVQCPGDSTGHITAFGLKPSSGFNSSLKINYGQTNTIGVTWDGTTLRFYVNGVLDGTTYTHSGNGVNPLAGVTGGTCYIGQENTGTFRAYYGIISDVRTYAGTVLTNTDMSNYAQGILPPYTMAMGYNFSEGSGTTTADLSGNSGTATLHGSPLPVWTSDSTNDLTRQTGKPLAAILSFSSVFTYLAEVIMTATLNMVGSTAKSTSRSIAAILSFVGGFTGTKFASFVQNLTATLSFTGNTVKYTPKAFAGVLNFNGSFLKQSGKIISAGLTFVGTHARMHIFYKALTASLSFTGSMSKRIQKALTSTLSFVGAQIRDYITVFLHPIDIAFVLLDSLLFTLKMPGALAFTVNKPITLNTTMNMPLPLEFTVITGANIFITFVVVPVISVTVVVPAPLAFKISK
jgi:hypothetical protein